MYHTIEFLSFVEVSSMGLVWVHLNATYAFFLLLLYLANKCTVYVNNYLFLIALLHVSMFIHHPQGVSYYVCQSYKLIKWK